MSIKWLTISQYGKMTGLSRESVKKMMDENELIWTTTDGGGKVLIKFEENEDISGLKNEISVLTGKVEQLMKHLGVRVQ